MENLRMKRGLVLFAIALAVSPISNAAKDGDLGTESDGEIGVSVNLVPAAKQISISGLRDIQFDKTIGDAATLDQTIAACVYMDKSGTFTVEADAGALKTGNRFYPYSVSVTQNTSGSPRINLDVEDMTEEGSATGFTPSSEVGCSSGSHLMIKFTDTGADALDEAFSASAIMYLKVIPD